MSICAGGQVFSWMAPQTVPWTEHLD